jgi:hypothetical protein
MFDIKEINSLYRLEEYLRLRNTDLQYSNINTRLQHGVNLNSNNFINENRKFSKKRQYLISNTFPDNISNLILTNIIKIDEELYAEFKYSLNDDNDNQNMKIKKNMIKKTLYIQMNYYISLYKDSFGIIILKCIQVSNKYHIPYLLNMCSYWHSLF